MGKINLSLWIKIDYYNYVTLFVVLSCIISDENDKFIKIHKYKSEGINKNGYFGYRRHKIFWSTFS